MSAQVGIPNYKDLINKAKLQAIYEKINNICLNYAKLASDDAINNREAEGYETYSNQYSLDLGYLKQICYQAQELVNACNDTMFLINDGAVIHHLRTFGDSEQ